MSSDSIWNTFRDADVDALLAFLDRRTMTGHRIQSTKSKLIYVDSYRLPHVVATRVNGQIVFPRPRSLRVLRLQVYLEGVLDPAELAGIPYSEKKRSCR